jgi:hypothetical protein
LEIVAIPIVRRIAEQVLQPPLPVTKIRKRQSRVTLALVRRIIHCHQQPLATGALPAKNQIS